VSCIRSCSRAGSATASASAITILTATGTMLCIRSLETIVAFGSKTNSMTLVSLWVCSPLGTAVWSLLLEG